MKKLDICDTQLYNSTIVKKGDFNLNKKYVKTLFSKSGNGVLTTRVSIPIQWILDLGITTENRDLELNYDKKNGQIIIKKI